MYNPKFYEAYQNTVVPENTNFNPYKDQYFGKQDTTPYTEGMNIGLPSGMAQNAPYPLQSSTQTPYLNTPQAYAKGGRVKKRGEKKNNPSIPFPQLAEMLRKQGQRGDDILAHINPEEAQMLEQTRGGDINPVTGLPQYGLFDNPGKWLKGSIGGIGGAVLGNMLLPGVGGLLGGALGGAAGSAARGRKDYGQAALRGLGTGAILPSVASLAGAGLNAVGATGMGGAATEYGSRNAILPALESLFGVGSAAAPSTLSVTPGAAGYGTGVNSAATAAAQQTAAPVAEAAKAGWWDSLTNNTADYFTKPENIISAASAGAKALKRPKKEKSAEELAEQQKRVDRILASKTPEEMAADEARLLAEAQMKRRVATQQFLPEDRLGDLSNLYVRANTPEEFAQQGKWLNYYDNPQFTGAPIPYKKGGSVKGFFDEFVESYPSGLIKGNDGLAGGQADDIRTALPEKSYIVNASVISGLGDGSTDAGAHKFNNYLDKAAPIKTLQKKKGKDPKLVHALISNDEFAVSPERVAKLGKGNIDAGTAILDEFMKRVHKHKGGSVKLPPKARSVESYMRGVKCQ